MNGTNYGKFYLFGRREPHRARLRSLAIFCSLGLAAFGVGCTKKEASASQDAPASPVKTIVVAPVSISDSSEYLATLKSRHSTALNPQVEGQVTEILVKSGDRVTSGTPLMQIDPLKQQATVGSLDAARAAQVANVQFAKIQRDRAQKLFDVGVISKMEFDQAQTTFDTAQQQLKAIEAQVREQQEQLHYYRVVAPTDGIVGDIPVHVGDRVSTSTLLTTIDQPGSLELYISVPVERSKDLKPGELVEILDTAGNVAADSRIDFISSEVDNTTQSILAKATVKNASGALRTSQFARARIVWGVHPGPVIPVLAVSRINGQFFVYVVEGSGKSLVARQRMLRLGELKDNQYPVLDGLKAGERLVVDGAQNLHDGAAVAEVPGTPGAKPSS